MIKATDVRRAFLRRIDMADENIIKVCGHCGHRTTFDIRAEFEYNRYDENSDTTEYNTWRILQCSSCQQPAFQEIQGWDGDPWDPPHNPSDRILYPITKTAPMGLPKEIKKEYEEA